MEDRFNYLLQKYLSRNASEEEESELKELILSNRYEEDFKEDVSQYLRQQMPDPSRSSETTEAAIPSADETRKHIGKMPFWYWGRIAAAVVIASGLGWHFLQRSTPSGTNQMAASSLSAESRLVRIDHKDFVRLPDGSTVLLNENSELTYTLPFGSETRQVQLKGEAFFDIVPDKTKPFTVQTGDISTNVLGTAFNVNATDQNVTVTVERGLVEVASRKKTLSLVHPAEQIKIDTRSSEFTMFEVNAPDELKWKEENLVFHNITLRETVELLEKRFNTKINISNSEIENCRISAWFLNAESLEDILEMVCGIRQARFEKKGNIFTITEGIGCTQQ